MTVGPKPRPAFERVMAHVEIDPSGCWLYTGNRPLGYGMVQTGSNLDGTRVPKLTHRVVYEVMVGPIPDGYQLHHTCHVKTCCNPDHLEPVDIAEHAREHHYQGDVCKACGESDWYQRPDRGRQCRTCNRRRKQRVA